MNPKLLIIKSIYIMLKFEMEIVIPNIAYTIKTLI